MENKWPVLCPENAEAAAYLWRQRQEMIDKTKGISQNTEMTLSKAYLNICNSKTPIKTIKDLSQIKGVGKWILKLMQGFFETSSRPSEPEEITKKSKKTKGPRRYVPQKNSVAYALLITIYRANSAGNEFMRKQELIDAAEASGLSRVPIAQEKGKGKRGFGGSPREWYSGWSCMKTLITKGLVVKSSSPAKYMLTEEGKEAARECLMRSGMTSPAENMINIDITSGFTKHSRSNLDDSDYDLDKEVTSPDLTQKKSIEIPLDSLERFTRMGYSREQVLHVFGEVSKSNPNKDISSLWPTVLCRLREIRVYGQNSENISRTNDYCQRETVTDGLVDLTCTENRVFETTIHDRDMPKFQNTLRAQSSFALRSCSSSDCMLGKSSADEFQLNLNVLSMPPLGFGERFEDAYQVILVLDDREQFATYGSRSRRIIDNICSQFKIQIQVRRLPVGDGIWIARHKDHETEYVLDFIVERKNVDDLRSSIRDNRYRDQKLRLLRCGLKKMIYLVEGDPNTSEAAESIKTACFTTEILDGFDVQRTAGLADTLKKYGNLTHAIIQYYKSRQEDENPQHATVCPPYDEFIKRSQDLDKMTVSDVFAVQLMQVPLVTEEVALAVLNLYPTLLSLASAYTLLDGDVRAQEDMLRRQSNGIVNSVASKHIFQFVWCN